MTRKSNGREAASMKRKVLCLCLLSAFIFGLLPPPGSGKTTVPKKYDLVLIHGFNNRHQWGYEFLNRLARNWGSGNVYVVYSNSSMKVWSMPVQGKHVIMMGENNHQAGNDSIEKQARVISRKISILQEQYGLGKNYYILAHSMGGLVARRLVYMRPGEVADLVTLGTPHQGTPLAKEYEWLGMFVNGQEGIKDVTPEAVARFNRRFPVEKSPFFQNGKLYTIAGDADGWGDRGWKGELAVGWTLLTLKYHTDSDGVVEEGKATLPGAYHVKTFWHLNHLELIQSPLVAEFVSKLLP
jgi:triacylglycerol lipase